jgi:hypothetical protein
VQIGRVPDPAGRLKSIAQKHAGVQLVEARLADTAEYREPDQGPGIYLGVLDPFGQLLLQVVVHLGPQHAGHRDVAVVGQRDNLPRTHRHRAAQGGIPLDVHGDLIAYLKVPLPQTLAYEGRFGPFLIAELRTVSVGGGYLLGLGQG